MKIAIAYPPLELTKGTPLLSQNRQFQWFNYATYIYPVVPAYAATLLQSKGYKVSWLDGIAEKWSYQKFLAKLEEEKIDLIAIETKTPTVKKYWKIINDLKKIFPKMKIVLMGDHVTALPEESMENCRVDYVVTGGDFDFSLLNLADHLTKKIPLEPGVFWREKGSIKNSGKFKLSHSLEQLPMIDRELTRWKLYAYNNGNFKYTPGTYTMIGRDCWWRKEAKQGGYGCTFCSWTNTFPQFRMGTPKQLLDEIGELIKLGVREVFDDTGTFPIGKWLDDFCHGMIERGYNKKIKFGCNMRPNAILDQKVYDLMGKAGFRFILYGLESANQKSLDRLNKGEKEGDIIKGTMMAKHGGLEPHVTCMVGYPWESENEAQQTINLTRSLFDKGYIDTLQATIVIPYPGTGLFSESLKEGWLKTEDWEHYDMREPILKSPIPKERIMELTQGIYSSFLTPKFILRKLSSIRSWDDISYYLVRGSQYIFGHLKDFTKFQLAKS